MFFKIFFTSFVLFSANLFCAVEKSSDIEKRLQKAGVKYHLDPDGSRDIFYIFDDGMYGVEHEKYAQLQDLLPTEMKYEGSIDYSRTHLLAEKGTAIITHDSEINQVATGFIYECVGLVMRQVNEDSSICKTLVAHGYAHNTYAPPGQQLYDDFNELTSIVDGFLAGMAPDTIKVDFVTTYNTDHLLDLYRHVTSKGVLKNNIRLTGNLPGDKRPIRKYIECHELINYPLEFIYFPAEYAVVALQPPHSVNKSNRITYDFWFNYLNSMSLFVDVLGTVYSNIKDYLEDAGLKARSPTLLAHHPHIRLGLMGVSRDGYYHVPNTTQACEVELARLESTAAQRLKVDA